MPANITTESVFPLLSEMDQRWRTHTLRIMVCPKILVDCYTIIYTHCQELMKSVGRCGSSFINAICDEGDDLALVSDSHKVVIALIMLQ